MKPHWIEKSVGWGLITYRTKILIIKENLRMQNYDVMMISTGDSFTMFPDMVKNQYEKYLNSK